MVTNARAASAAPDVVMVGGGIMSATLAALLGLVQPDWSVVVLESGPSVGLESSDPWNNAGTGHAALCELNYTPAGPDGTVDPSKAVGINEQFQVSRQLWSSLVRAGLTDDPKTFITSVPHVSFVTGTDGQRYMRARYEALKAQPLFSELEHTADPSELAEWVPLVVAGRDPAQPVAATRSLAGTDVNFGALTGLLLDAAQRRGVHVATGTRVTGLKRTPSGRWQVQVQDVATGHRSALVTRFVFVGAGGGALPLLQHSGIKEIRGFGGFPVSGQFLRTRRKDLVSQHHAKVYGQAEVGAPPMSVPHLDLRSVDGEQSLLFGPYAGFSPKFLKAGSLFDLPRSVKANNLSSMLGVARSEMALTKYLVQQVLQTRGQRMEALRSFFPEAGDGDWELITAGQRVQVIKKDQRGRGVLQFGTELVTGADGSIAGLLGASPGASTAASAMLTLLERCFPERMDAWRPLLTDVIPSYGRKLSADASLAQEVREETARTLHLTA
ncbi:malate:quinone oxidoreductase [Quadrisphaera oryzae]|uniref:malate:quinone oxidoreductase n=1 Tax=Quadrisphaera TaxID=317661 RepID=UPI00351C4114